MRLEVHQVSDTQFIFDIEIPPYKKGVTVHTDLSSKEMIKDIINQVTDDFKAIFTVNLYKVLKDVDIKKLT